jgi:hypothetical protein
LRRELPEKVMIPQDGTLIGAAVLGVIFTTCRHDGIIMPRPGFSNRSPRTPAAAAPRLASSGEQLRATSTGGDHTVWFESALGGHQIATGGG